MNDHGPPPVFWVFLGVWVALTIGSFWFFGFKRDARLKRTVLPWFVAFTGVLFCFFVVLISGGEFWHLFFVAPAVALISLLNVWLIRFCDSCGATAYNYTWFWPMRFCPRCGAPLTRKHDDVPENPDDGSRSSAGGAS